MDILRTYLRLHMRLFPYEWTYAKNLATDGRPITRPFGLVYPDLGIHPNDVYLFGDDLLVAPVVTPGATTREVVLPPGKWTDWWDGREYDGGDAGGAKVTIPAPLDKLPLLARTGSVIPLLRPTIDTMSPTTAAPEVVDSFAADPGLLWLRAFHFVGTAGFVVYDGTSVKPVDGNIEFTPGAVFTQGMIFELVGGKSDDVEVSLDSAGLVKLPTLEALIAAQSGLFDNKQGSFWIKLPPGKHKLAISPIGFP